MAGMAIVGGDGSKYTSDESPRRSRAVVSPYTWPLRVKIAKIHSGEREPTQNSVLGAGHLPTEANTGVRRGTGAKLAAPDEEDYATIFRGSEAARSTTVMFRGRLQQMGQEIGFSVGVALAAIEGVVERGEKLEPPLNSRIVVSHFADAFERRVIREDAKLRAPEVASKAFDGPGNAASFHVTRSPMPIGIEGSAADVSDGAH